MLTSYEVNAGTHAVITWPEWSTCGEEGYLVLCDWMAFIPVSTMDQSQFILSACSSADPRLQQIQSAVHGIETLHVIDKPASS